MAKINVVFLSHKLCYVHFCVLMVLLRAAQIVEAGLCSVSQSKNVRVHWCVTSRPEFPPENKGCFVNRTTALLRAVDPGCASESPAD